MPAASKTVAMASVLGVWSFPSFPHSGGVAGEVVKVVRRVSSSCFTSPADHGGLGRSWWVVAICFWCWCVWWSSSSCLLRPAVVARGAGVWRLSAGAGGGPGSCGGGAWFGLWLVGGGPGRLPLRGVVLLSPGPEQGEFGAGRRQMCVYPPSDPTPWGWWLLWVKFASWLGALSAPWIGFDGVDVLWCLRPSWSREVEDGPGDLVSEVFFVLGGSWPITCILFGCTGSESCIFLTTI